MSWVQVVAAVRMVLYHMGQLEKHEGSVRRVWEKDEDVASLCEEMLRLADLMKPAPKLLLQVRVCPHRCASSCSLQS